MPDSVVLIRNQRILMNDRRVKKSTHAIDKVTIRYSVSDGQFY